MKRTFILFTVAGTLLAGALFVQAAISRRDREAANVAREAAAPAETQDTPAPIVQLAILLDTSGSMDGLIDQARTRLWRVVNELAEMKRDGRTPELQVALYEYGNSAIPERDGYLRKVQGFTTDLDEVSRGLFSLTTNGGSEYCGQVIEASLRGLSWARDPETLKMIFIAGNERFDQGPVDYRSAIAAAREMGVVVNTVHCGPESSGIAGHWREGALLAAGRFHSIDQNEALTWIAAPQDDEIARLGTQLNQTAMAYGTLGNRGASNQSAQDANAESAGRGAAVQRAMTKGTRVYDTSKWDLVSAIKKKKTKIARINKRLLAKKYADLDDDQLAAEVGKLQKRRDYLRGRLATLKNERKVFVARERRKKGTAEARSLDASMAETIKLQAKKARFKVGAASAQAPADAAGQS